MSNVKLERFECTFYGCLLRIIIATKFFWWIKVKAWNIRGVEISELKAFRLLKEQVEVMEAVLVRRSIKLEKFIRMLWEAFGKSALKEKKKGKLTPSLILNGRP